METDNGKEYVLTMGYKRLNALKKLGYKTAPCYLAKEKTIVEIPVNNIFVSENNRLEEHSDEITELMESIKQTGLLVPLGVSRAAELTQEEFIIYNIIENFHRSTPSPFNLVIAIRKLMQVGLNSGEIAVKLSMPKTRIDNALRLGASLSDEDLKKVSFIPTGETRNRKGRLSFTVARTISSLRINEDKKKEILDIAKRDQLDYDEVDIIGRLVMYGMSVSKAVKEREKYKTIHPKLVVSVEELKKMGYTNKQALGSLIAAMLAGKEKLNKDLIYFGKELNQ